MLSIGHIRFTDEKGAVSTNYHTNSKSQIRKVVFYDATEWGKAVFHFTIQPDQNPVWLASGAKPPGYAHNYPPGWHDYSSGHTFPNIATQGKGLMDLLVPPQLFHINAQFMNQIVVPVPAHSMGDNVLDQDVSSGKMSLSEWDDHWVMETVQISILSLLIMCLCAFLCSIGVISGVLAMRMKQKALEMA